MKKIKNFIMVSLMALMMTLMSCGDSTLKAINEKIEKEGTSATFTQKEYAAMADYLDKNYMKMFKEFSKLDYEDDDIEEKFDKLENKYPNINEYMMILAFADAEGELDKKNSMKWKKISNDVKDYYKNNYGVDFDDNKYESNHGTNSIRLSHDFLAYDFDGYYICHDDNNEITFYLTYVMQSGEGAIQLSDGNVMVLKYNERIGQYFIWNVYTLDGEKTHLDMWLDIDDGDGSVDGILRDINLGKNFNFSGILIEN